MSDPLLVRFDPDASGYQAVYWTTRPGDPVSTKPVVGWATFEEPREQIVNYTQPVRHTHAAVLTDGQVTAADRVPGLTLWNVVPPGEPIPATTPRTVAAQTDPQARWELLKSEIPRLIGRENGEKVPYDNEYGTALNDVLTLMERLQSE